MILEEVAPGIDIQTQVLDRCDARSDPSGGRSEADGRVSVYRGWIFSLQMNIRKGSAIQRRRNPPLRTAGSVRFLF